MTEPIAPVNTPAIDLNVDHKPITKELLRSWLVKFGIPEGRFFSPSEDDLKKASESMRPILENMLIVPYKYTSDKTSQSALMFEAKISIVRKWINVKLMIIRHEEIPAKMKLPLYEKLLQANFSLNEVTFSMSDDMDVYVEADMPVITDYVNFESEYGSVEFGVDYFLSDIVPNVNELSVKDTFNPALYT